MRPRPVRRIMDCWPEGRKCLAPGPRRRRPGWAPGKCAAKARREVLNWFGGYTTKIAVFIDFDNIEIGVKNTLGAAFDAGLVLEALKERGDVVSKIAYSDWQRAGGLQPQPDAARHQDGAAQPDAGRRQERRRHQSRARRARDGVHASAHQRLRHRRRRQRLHQPGREAQAVRQENLRGGWTAVHQHHHAEELSRVHCLREPRRRTGGRSAADAARQSGSRRVDGCRSTRPCRS